MRRVVITGCGLVSSLGVGVSYVWNQLLNGHSGIKHYELPLDNTNLKDLPVKIAGTIPRGTEFGALDLSSHFSKSEIKRYSNFVKYGLVAAKEAMKDSGWCVQSERDAERSAVYVGSGIGGIDCIEQEILGFTKDPPHRVSPFFVSENIINSLSGHLSIDYQFASANFALGTACATAAHSIGEGARLIQMDDADVVIAGGAESPLALLSVLSFSSMKALSIKYNDHPTLASRPWDVNRDGFVLSEGAAILVLEEYEHAKKRKAKIYGELLGYGFSSDAYHMVAPEPTGKGAQRSMKNSLRKAHLNPEDIHYINAHATSTPLGDQIELLAIKELFGNKPTARISSTKSSTGHMLGATGGMEAIFSLLAIQHQVCPATINLVQPDPLAQGMNLIPQTPQESKVQTVMSNSFGFGGSNATLIFKKI